MFKPKRANNAAPAKQVFQQDKFKLRLHDKSLELDMDRRWVMVHILREKAIRFPNSEQFR